MTVESKLREIVESVIDRKRGAIKISPAWVATEAMHIIDPDRSGPELEYFGCHLELRQIAREALRGHYQPDGSVRGSAQHELFPDLQERYPRAGQADSEEPEYVLLEYMTNEDIAYNVARLRREASSKQAHADALEAYGRRRSRAG